MKRYASACLVVAGMFCLSVWAAGPVAAQETATAPDQGRVEHVVVSIDAVAGLKPQSVTVNRGTTVVWVNQAAGDVAVMFTARQVTRACKNPGNFTVHDDKYFISNNIPQGGVASLCFIEAGSYDYLAQLSRKDAVSLVVKQESLAGTVIVQ